MRLVAVVLLILAAAPAFAQDDRAKRIELASGFVELTTADSVMDPMVDAMWPTVEMQMGSAIDVALAEKLKAVFATEIKNALTGVLDELAGLYADAFTLAELEAISKFYNSEAGIKLVSNQGALMQQMLPTITGRLTQSMPQAMEKVMAEAEAEGVDVN